VIRAASDNNDPTLADEMRFLMPIVWVDQRNGHRIERRDAKGYFFEKLLCWFGLGKNEEGGDKQELSTWKIGRQRSQP